MSAAAAPAPLCQLHAAVSCAHGFGAAVRADGIPSSPPARGHVFPAIHLTPMDDLILLGVAATIAAAFLVAYLISLSINPFAMCRRCGGTGKVGGMFFSWGRNFCPWCVNGLVPRLGTRMLGAGHWRYR
jgi:hypothetical protein